MLGLKDTITWFKPCCEKYVVGRDGWWVADALGLSTTSDFANFLEDYVPGLHEMAQIHDTMVDAMTPDPNTFAPVVGDVTDVVTNVPTMPIAYAESIIANTVDSIIDLF